MAGEMWERHWNRTVPVDDYHLHPTVIFTTEATSMVNEQKAFASENKVVARYPDLQFDFISNPHDVTPNSGYMSDSRRAFPTKNVSTFSILQSFSLFLFVSILQVNKLWIRTQS